MRNFKIKEQQQIEFHRAVESMTRDETYAYCKTLMESSRKPNHTIMNGWKTMGKDRIVLSMSNFILKGSGYGVC